MVSCNRRFGMGPLEYGRSIRVGAASLVTVAICQIFTTEGHGSFTEGHRVGHPARAAIDFENHAATTRGREEASECVLFSLLAL